MQGQPSGLLVARSDKNEILLTNRKHQFFERPLDFGSSNPEKFFLNFTKILTRALDIILPVRTQYENG